MTNQEIENVGIAMSVLLDNMNVEDQMVAVTSVMQAVVMRAALECHK
jgi:energy-converting hydrogenase Eha subunit E